MRRWCVFCGSSEGNLPVYSQQARQFGERLLSEDIGLVFGGGNVGLMGVIADIVIEGGGEVIGVIPHSLQKKEVDHKGVTRMIVVDSMHERKKQMHDLADAFVVLPGGLGTLDELFDIWSLTQLGIQKKPIGILNTNNFYDSLLGFLNEVQSTGFVRETHLEKPIITESLDELVKQLLEN